MKRILAIALLWVIGAGAWLPAQVIRPEDLKFPPLTFTPPRPDQFRSTLGIGLRTYLLEDHSLPIVSITALVPFGSLHDPAEKKGLSSLLANTLIKGGTRTLEGTAIEDKLDLLGATLTFNAEERISTLTLSVLSKNLAPALEIFADVLTRPEFREESLTLARSRLIERLRQANDQPSTVLSREYEKLLYGRHPLTNQPFKKTLEAVARQDLKEAHARFFAPNNVILAAAGDFKKASLQSSLGRLLKGWKAASVKTPAFSREFPAPEPGVYYIQKEINQGYISMGHLGIEDSNPDYFAVQVMNFILGGGSFTSRITTKVRSDEGLAYNTGSRFTFRWGFPGTFAGYVQTKSATVGYAIELIRQEFERIRNQPVLANELETAK